MCMRLFELTSHDLIGQAPCVVFGVLLAVRHEVASITVKSVNTEFHPLFHQRFPTLRHEVAFIAVMPVPQDIT